MSHSNDVTLGAECNAPDVTLDGNAAGQGVPRVHKARGSNKTLEQGLTDSGGSNKGSQAGIHKRRSWFDRLTRRCEPQDVTPVIPLSHLEAADVVPCVTTDNALVTPDVKLRGFTVSISPIKPASECEDVEDSPIVADLLARGSGPGKLNTE